MELDSNFDDSIKMNENKNKKIIINLIKHLNSADVITSADMNSDSDVQLNEALSSKKGYNKIKTISEELNELWKKDWQQYKHYL